MRKLTEEEIKELNLIDEDKSIEEQLDETVKALSTPLSVKQIILYFTTSILYMVIMTMIETAFNIGKLGIAGVIIYTSLLIFLIISPSWFLIRVLLNPKLKEEGQMTLIFSKDSIKNYIITNTIFSILVILILIT